VPPVSCPDIDSHSLFNLIFLYNPVMSPLRWLSIILSIAIGIGLGIFYGRVISPVQYVDTTPSNLRADFRADYTLMVAETFQNEQDLDKAARRLAILGSQPPIEFVSQALNFARQNKYTPSDISLLENLSTALRVWQPGATPQPAAPAATTQAQPGQP
jgi:hypothetical protein